MFFHILSRGHMNVSGYLKQQWNYWDQWDPNRITTVKIGLFMIAAVTVAYPFYDEAQKKKSVVSHSPAQPAAERVHKLSKEIAPVEHNLIPN